MWTNLLSLDEKIKTQRGEEACVTSQNQILQNLDQKASLSPTHAVSTLHMITVQFVIALSVKLIHVIFIPAT